MRLGSEGEWDRDDVGIVFVRVSTRESLVVTVGQKDCTVSVPVIFSKNDNAISHGPRRETGGRRFSR